MEGPDTDMVVLDKLTCEEHDEFEANAIEFDRDNPNPDIYVEDMNDEEIGE